MSHEELKKYEIKIDMIRTFIRSFATMISIAIICVTILGIIEVIIKCR